MPAKRPHAKYTLDPRDSSSNGSGNGSKSGPRAEPAHALTFGDVTYESEEHQETHESEVNLKENKRTSASAGARSATKEETGTTHGESTAPAPTPEQTDDEVFRDDLANGMPPSLPVTSYIVQSINEHWRHVGQEEGWQSPLWYFMRVLKCHPDLERAKWSAVVKRIEDMMKCWRNGRVKKHPDRFAESDWQYWLGTDTETAHAEFQGSWEKIRYLPGHDPLRNAYRMFLARPVTLNKEIREDRTKGYEQFVGLAGWLQVTMGDKPILLPVHRIHELFATTTMTVSRWRQQAIKDGFIVKVKAGTYKPGGRGEADQFRFNVSLVPMLDERAKDGTAALFEAAHVKAEIERKRREALRAPFPPAPYYPDR